MSQRKATSVRSRITDCDICNFPLTEVHHILDFAEYGESDVVCNLCPNCHSLYHLSWNALVDKSPRSVKVWQGFLSKTNGQYPHTQAIINKVQEAYQLKLEYDLSNTNKSRGESAFKIYI